jgi:hypothetical protein
MTKSASMLSRNTSRIGLKNNIQLSFGVSFFSLTEMKLDLAYPSFICAFVSLLSSSCATQFAARNCSPESFQRGSDKLKVKISRFGMGDSGKSIIIIPPTGRTNYIDRKYAQAFCKAGFDAYIMDQWTGDIETTTELEIHQRFYGAAQKAIAVVLEETKSPYIGLLGTSVGALHAIIAASVQERIQAVFSIAGGIPIAEVIVNSNQEAMVNLKKDRQIRYGFQDAKENINAIEKVFSWEPEQLPELFKKKDLGVSIGLKDETVPAENQKKLVEFWKPSKVITYSNDHFWTIVKTWLFKSDEVVEFFENSFKSM